MSKIVSDLGNRMKAYEGSAEMRFDPQLPIMARLDGRGFSKLTASLTKPDFTFNECMMETARVVVEKTHAAVGYVQSDEISIVLLPGSEEGSSFFDGRVQKLASVMSSIATLAFNRALDASPISHLADRAPVFDCRVYQVPSIGEAANAILWRVRDATKNAISMVAGENFSPKTLHGVSTRERIEMLAGIGVDFNADYPDSFRNGTFWRRGSVLRLLTDVERERIPEQHRPAADVTVKRSSVDRIPMPDRIMYGDIVSLLEKTA